MITRTQIFSIITLPLLVMFIITLLISGCAKRITTPGTPQVSAFERTVSTIRTVNALTQAGVSTLNQTGVIKDSVAKSITGYNLTVTEGITAIETIKASDKTDEEKAIAIQTAVETLKLPTEVRAFVATPSTNKAITSVIALIDFLRALITLLVK